MIVVDRNKLRFLLAGRTLTVETPRTPKREYRPRRDYAIGTSHRRAVCRATVLHVAPNGEVWTLKLRIVQEDSPRLLAAASQYGYTQDPAKAMRDEPEAVDAPTQRRLTELGTARWSQQHHERECHRLARSLSIRLKAAVRSGDRAEIAAIRSELERLERAA